MNKPNLAGIVKNVQNAVVKHSPEILTGLGIAGMLSAGYLAVRATPKALENIEEAKKEQDVDKLPPVEVIKATWKCYIPAVALSTVSAACLIGATSVNLRRNAALATAYKLSETALTEYREQVVETIGEKKEKTVREKVNQKQIDKTPVSKSEVYVTGKGESLCLDPLSKRYFKSDIDRIRKAENELNKRLLHDIVGSASLNEFYDELGLERTDIGDAIGWNTEHLIDLDISPGMTDKEEPCLVIGHYNAPKWDY